MTTREDGGSAFPYWVTREETIASPGISVRDYFAAKALQGMLSDADTYGQQLAKHGGGVPLDTFLSAMAYRYADAMLKERTK